jgi:PiT family inorganic phosphate transporter
MTSSEWLLALFVFAVTFANGANDNFKGVATLFGSGAASYRRALWWATATTAAGCLTALALAASLAARFNGKGLVPDALTADPAFLAAVGAGAAATVLLATRLGFPISTTHALTGALVGAGLVAVGQELRFAALGADFVAPLLLSPIAAAFLVTAVHAVFGAVGRRWHSEDVCLCGADKPDVPERPAVAGVRFVHASCTAADRVPIVARVSECAAHGLVPTATAQRALDAAHFVSAGAVGFARGVNDTPKLLALMLPAHVLPTRAAVVLLTAVMAMGGLVAARRVAETMSHRVTTMTPRQGFAANVTTAMLVLFASRFGLSVSTTHVSSGSLFGLGAVTGQARWRTVIQIVLAWVVTLPCAAACAALALWILR